MSAAKSERKSGLSENTGKVAPKNVDDQSPERSGCASVAVSPIFFFEGVSMASLTGEIGRFTLVVTRNAFANPDGTASLSTDPVAQIIGTRTALNSLKIMIEKLLAMDDARRSGKPN